MTSEAVAASLRPPVASTATAVTVKNLLGLLGGSV